MIDLERLAEIVARAERWEVKGTVEAEIDGEPWGVEGVVGIAVTIREADYNWSLARIRELEAQAARYKAGLLDLAIEIGGCRCGPEYTGRGLIAPDCAWHQSSTPEILEEAGLLGEYQARLDAALAAREEGKC